MNCEFCHKPTHVWYECKDKPPGWKPARLAKKFRGSLTEEHRLRESSNAATEDNSPSLASDVGQSESMGPVVRKMRVAPQGSTPAPGAIRKPGRPKTGFDKAAYNRNYMRDKRARSKPIQ